MKPLSFSQLQERISELASEKHIAAFYIKDDRVGQIEWMRPLAGKLKARGWETFALTDCASKTTCAFGGAAIPAVVANEDVIKLGRINVFILLDYDCNAYFPTTSKVLICPHCLFTMGSDYALPGFLELYGRADGLLTPIVLKPGNRQAINDLWNGIFHPSLFANNHAEFHIISAGYPSLCVLSQKLRNSRLPCDALLYAPTMMSWASHCGGNRLVAHGKQVIIALLEEFPDYKIIFRPSPQDVESQPVTQICKDLQNERRFIFDRTRDRHFSFARAQLLITDLSTMSATFACATERPIIFFQPWNETREKSINYGHYVFSLQELVAECRYCLDHMTQEKSSLTKKLAGVFMPFDHALDEIAAGMEDFLADRTRPNWVTLKKSDSGFTKSDVTIIGLLQQHDLACMAAQALFFSQLSSPLLIAFALHAGAESTPRFANAALFNLASQFLGEEISAPDFDAFPKDKIRRLYKIALLEKIKSHDVEGKKLAETLLNKFNDLFPEQHC